MMLRLSIIRHDRQRYPTVGDYFKRLGIWWFRASRMGDERYSWLILFHEIIEWGLVKLNRIPMKEIDDFDIAYEESREWQAVCKDPSRAPCGCDHYDEPGDDPHAPYHHAHQVATKCERIIAESLGVNWLDYSDTVESL